MSVKDVYYVKSYRGDPGAATSFVEAAPFFSLEEALEFYGGFRAANVGESLSPVLVWLIWDGKGNPVQVENDIGGWEAILARRSSS